MLLSWSNIWRLDKLRNKSFKLGFNSKQKSLFCLFGKTKWGLHVLFNSFFVLFLYTENIDGEILWHVWCLLVLLKLSETDHG